MMDHCQLRHWHFYLKCILSNPLLFNLASNPCPRWQLRPWLWEQARQQRKEWNRLHLNLKPFVCCCLCKECTEGWAAEKPQWVYECTCTLCTCLTPHTHILVHYNIGSIAVAMFSKVLLSFDILLKRAPTCHYLLPPPPPPPLPLSKTW